MKTIFILTMLIASGPAVAQNAMGSHPSHNSGLPFDSTLRCFQDQPHSGDHRRDQKWLDTCIADAKKL